MIDPSAQITVETSTPPLRSRRRVVGGRVITVIALAAATVVLVVTTTPKGESIEWVSGRGPQGSVNVDTLVAFADGFAVLSGMTARGVLLWSSGDGSSWNEETLREAPSQLAVVGDTLIAYDGLTGRAIEWVDDQWMEGNEFLFPDNVRSRSGTGRPSLIGDGNSLLAVGLAGDIWLSEGGSDFVEVISDTTWGPGTEQPFDSACQPRTRTSPDIPPIVATDVGFLAMTSSNPVEPFGISPVCEPVIWESGDGRDWVRGGSPFETRAFVQDLAWREGRFVAVGGFGLANPAAWTSRDGADWETIAPVGSWGAVDLVSVDSGPAGWVVVGRLGDSSGFIGWASPDGVCWEALPPFVEGGDAAIATTHIMLIDRARYPELWIGTLLSAPGVCG